MINALFQNSLAVKIIINTLFVSIPEELYGVMFTLIMIGEFEYWKEAECKRLINRFDYVRVFLPTITGALLSNILINTGLNHGFFQFLSPIVTFIIIVFTNDIFGDASTVKWLMKAFVFYLIGFLSIGISEFSYLPIVLYSTGLTMPEIRENLYLYFLLSLPARFLQYTLLSCMISRRRTLLKGRLVKNLLAHPVLIVIFTFLVLTNILFLWFMYRSIIFERKLLNIPVLYQFFTTIGIVSFPMVNISSFLWGFYLLKNKETVDKKVASEKLHILLKDIESYTNNEKYDNIRWKLNEVSMGIEEVAEKLYKDDGLEKMNKSK